MTRAFAPQASDVPFWTAKNLAAPDIAHGFFGRQGGVSSGIFDSLNCGPGSGDDLDKVLENRRIVAQALSAQGEGLSTLYQVHGDKCITISEPWDVKSPPQADALVTDQPGLPIGILTADCAPVLFAGRKADGAPVIGAAHAGWGGAFKGILEATIEGLVKLGAEKDSIAACIGPCIHRRSYEVGPEFFQRFVDVDEENERFFQSAQKAEHYMFDLGGYAAARLYRAGLRKVEVLDVDTYGGETEFFSYRRTTHRKENDYGRQVSAIMIKHL